MSKLSKKMTLLKFKKSKLIPYKMNFRTIKVFYKTQAKSYHQKVHFRIKIRIFN
jgi:hypothetical protein